MDIGNRAALLLVGLLASTCCSLSSGQFECLYPVGGYGGMEEMDDYLNDMVMSEHIREKIESQLGTPVKSIEALQYRDQPSVNPRLYIVSVKVDTGGGKKTYHHVKFAGVRGRYPEDGNPKFLGMRDCIPGPNWPIEVF